MGQIVGKAQRLNLLSNKPAQGKIPSTPIFFHCNKLDTTIRSTSRSALMKPKHLIHEIDKIFFFSQGLDSHQSGGFLSSIKESLLHPLLQRFDTPASMVRIASSGDTHRPPRTPRDDSESRFRTYPSSVIFGWSCPQLLRRRRARREHFAGQLFLLRERFQSSEPKAFATQHSARFAGSRSTIARVTNQCRK